MSEAALLDAIAAAPEDLSILDVYADWLEEHGERERAELVRLELDDRRGRWIESPMGRWARRRRRYMLESLLDRDWQRRALDPPVVLARRRDPAWLRAVLGEPEARAALGREAPPSLLGDAVLDAKLLWGWPSGVLFTFAFAAVRHALDACIAGDCVRDLPIDEIRDLVDRIEIAATTRTNDTVGLPDEARALGGDLPYPTAPHAQVKHHVRSLASLLVRALAPYQSYDNARPDAVFVALTQAIGVRHLVAWAQPHVFRGREASRFAEGRAKAAAARLAKAETQLRVRPSRIEAFGGDAGETIDELVARRDRKRLVAQEQAALAQKLAATAPPKPSRHREAHALLSDVCPKVTAWIRAQPTLEIDPLIVDTERVFPFERGITPVITYGPDGRMTRSWR